MNRIETVRQQVDEILLGMSDKEERRCGYVHLYGVAQACALLAKKRGENVELAVIAGMLHDVYSYAKMDSTDHAHKGAVMAREILENLEIFSEEDVENVCTAIYRHSDKAIKHNALDEILKDADVLQHVWYNPLFEVNQARQERYEKLVNELGIEKVMAKVITICGKICSGKSYYAKQIKEKEKSVILSCDELTKDLFDNDLGERHDEMALRIWGYFKKKSVELVKAGCTVILDWGFWSRENRKTLSEFYREQGIPCEWHYIDVDDETWKRNIEERNQRVLSGEGGSDYYLDEGLMEKLESMWEAPEPEEIDVWYRLVRE